MHGLHRPVEAQRLNVPVLRVDGVDAVEGVLAAAHLLQLLQRRPRLEGVHDNVAPADGDQAECGEPVVRLREARRVDLRLALPRRPRRPVAEDVANPVALEARQELDLPGARVELRAPGVHLRLEGRLVKGDLLGLHGIGRHAAASCLCVRALQGRNEPRS